MFEMQLQNIVTDRVRVEAVDRLSKHGLKLFGNSAWTSTIPFCRGTIDALQVTPAVRSHSTLMDIYNGSLISINIPQAQAHGALQYRLFDIMASNSLLISQFHPNCDLERLFGAGCPVPLFKTLAEMERLCAHYLNEEGERKALVEKCNALVSEGFDFVDRCHDILRLSKVILPSKASSKLGITRVLTKNDFRYSANMKSNVSIINKIKHWYKNTLYAGKLSYRKRRAVLRYYLAGMAQATKTRKEHPFPFRKMQFFPIQRVSDYAGRYNAEQRSLSCESYTSIPRPVTSPEKSAGFMKIEQQGFHFPGVNVTTIKDAFVTGFSNLITTEKTVLFHDIFKFSHDIIAEEQFERIWFQKEKERVAWITKPHLVERLSQAACFTDANSHNYAHWLTEILPRAHAYCKQNEDERTAIITDVLHQNMDKSLRLIIGNRRLICLTSAECVFVQNLQLTSPTGYIPFERRNKEVHGHSHGVFDGGTLQSMRSHFHRLLSISFDDENTKYFLRRNGAVRNIINQYEIEQMLVERGFHVIEPETLTFVEQVEIFSRASVIVGATGSAIANLLFCPPSAKIVIFIPNFPNTSYWYWHHMARAVGNSVTYVIGERDDISKPFEVHSDFRVSPEDIVSVLK